MHVWPLFPEPVESDQIDHLLDSKDWLPGPCRRGRVLCSTTANANMKVFGATSFLGDCGLKVATNILSEGLT